MIDRELHTHLENLKQGNLESFRWVYNFYSGRVYQFCRSFIKCPEDVEELTSDVFVRIWQKRNIIDTSLSLQPLLMKITRDLTWNYLKRIARQRDHQVFFENYRNPLAQGSDDELIFNEYQEIIRHALQKLTPQQQKIFTLHYLTGKDLTQISEELQISKNTVKAHLATSKRLILRSLPINIS